MPDRGNIRRQPMISRHIAAAAPPPTPVDISRFASTYFIAAFTPFSAYQL